jgi:hypothetical protein
LIANILNAQGGNKLSNKWSVGSKSYQCNKGLKTSTHWLFSHNFKILRKKPKYDDEKCYQQDVMKPQSKEILLMNGSWEINLERFFWKRQLWTGS